MRQSARVPRTISWPAPGIINWPRCRRLPTARADNARRPRFDNASLSRMIAMSAMSMTRLGSASNDTAGQCPSASWRRSATRSGRAAIQGQAGGEPRATRPPLFFGIPNAPNPRLGPPPRRSTSARPGRSQGALVRITAHRFIGVLSMDVRLRACCLPYVTAWRITPGTALRYPALTKNGTASRDHRTILPALSGFQPTVFGQPTQTTNTLGWRGTAGFHQTRKYEPKQGSTHIHLILLSLPD